MRGESDGCVMGGSRELLLRRGILMPVIDRRLGSPWPHAYVSSVCLPFLLAFLNPYAYYTTTNSLTLPMPIHPSTYLFIHTCMVHLIHFTSHYFIYHLKAALLSSHFELTLRIPCSIHFLIPRTRTFFFFD